MNSTIPIAKPPWTGLGKRIESLIRKALYEHGMGQEQKLAIALSGGKDSLTLLYMLAAIRNRGFPNWELHAIHVSGAFSCGAGVDEGYLRAICQALDVQYHTYHTEQKLEDLECYSCSRERRRLIFEAAKSVGAQEIAFGHHRDDLIQTLMLNLLHKAEFSGMLPKIEMQKFGVTITRPLVYVTEEEIKEFSQQHNFSRVMCRCPVGSTSKRKRVEQLIDLLENDFPNARGNLAQAGLHYGSDKASRA